nr:MAG TPA: Ras-related protein Rab-8A, Guanine nucleotide GTPase, Guanine Nucleotide Exchange [Caudoviricetes sp.]
MTSRIWCLLASALLSVVCKCPKRNHFGEANKMVLACRIFDYL